VVRDLTVIINYSKIMITPYSPYSNKLWHKANGVLAEQCQIFGKFMTGELSLTRIWNVVGELNIYHLQIIKFQYIIHLLNVVFLFSRVVETIFNLGWTLK